MLSAPTSTAPAASMRSISVASRVAGARSRLIFEPARVGEARDVEQILHREGHAGERADGLAGGDIGIDRARFGTGAIGGDVGEGIEDGVVLLDARERCFGRIERGHLAARNRARDLGGRHLWLGRHGGVRP